MPNFISPEGIEYWEYDDEDKARFAASDNEYVRRIATGRFLIPTMRWGEPTSLTVDGYEIVNRELLAEYPEVPEDSGYHFSSSNHEQADRWEGWPCYGCGSTETVVWESWSTLGEGSFECLNCSATGSWVVECPRSPSPVHLDGECECVPDYGCSEPEGYRSDWRLGGTLRLPVPMPHRPGCRSASKFLQRFESDSIEMSHHRPVEGGTTPTDDERGSTPQHNDSQGG